MTSGDDDVSPLSPAIRARIDLARRSLPSMSLQQRSRGHARAIARFVSPKISASSWAIAGLVVAASLAFALRVWRSSEPPPPLSFALEGGVIAEDGALRGSATGDRRPIVRFSDGTQIELGAGARAHIASLTEHGATISLDEGEVRARVVHWDGARWLFDAGPCVVTVTGTAFALSWKPDEERIDLRLENGSVEVGGPIFDQPIPLRSGKWLTIRLRQREILIRDIREGAAGEGAPAAFPPGQPASPEPDEDGAVTSPQSLAPPVPSAVEPPLAGAGVASAAPVPTPAPKRDWAAKVAAGKFEQVVDDAERWGLDACLAGASSSELSSLADAARYTKRSGLSKQALLAQRQRFAGTRRATEAAFLLGRLAESQEGAESAVSWFEKYLAEAPSGPYAPEALGRRMVLVEKMSGRGAAAKVAQEYLLRFPRGTYARTARAMLQAP
jgi:TolA-binding protein